VVFVGARFVPGFGGFYKNLALFMQKIKDTSRSEAKTQSQSPERSEGEAWGKKIKISHLQTAFTIFYKINEDLYKLKISFLKE